MTGNLSRTVLRGAGARESAHLPDLTKIVYDIQLKTEKAYLFPVKKGRFFL
ncbi:hypothetical protein DEU47_1197 [Bacillus sp. AG236]|nr:hypothetical protein DEU47_1197 [Bacillus sp. AG236]